ncbi:Arginase/deacetylase [Yamadazyma tenuis ATCC 10573]|uniref:Arginase/deacetylase n=1 Tax=Candida tenuis (strain ATCC 10573 / BCRC 21748 / CBS 615 / JCM 9827 / NBRC 10315 / NRRL Y-1498 / VKM Y-70) TaxID=590646 RepID=G3BEM5_CANTC|nr:Arginase/deacetylase [Yamadazyma tenuis ATCC 10573]EGV59928.1 Arginase/deacetylase [Yamadazyma tenuis ATCC 10573]
MRLPNRADLWGGYWPFQGINTFAHLESHNCLLEPEQHYDIAVIGVPFDTATSYRPGARFGPRAIRTASQRQTSLRGFNQRAMMNPYQNWAKIVDCGDIPVTPMDNELAFKQMTMAFEELIYRRDANSTLAPPRYVALGGDHSVLLPHLRALHSIYGPLNVIHFDAHLDTWTPEGYPSYWHSDQSELNHGSMLWKANQEGLTSTHNIHAGLRTKLSGVEDYISDDEQHFERIYADDIWVEGVKYVIDKILDTVPKDTPTYLSVDIDVLDPGFGSGTGTQEPGGWLPRELLYVLRAIDGLNIVGADVVEVSPAFDNAEITATNGAQVAYEIITSMVKKGKTDDLVKNNTPQTTAKMTNHQFINEEETISKKGIKRYEEI